MTKSRHLIAMSAGAALLATTGMASAASMEDYKKARAAAIQAAEEVEQLGYGSFAWSPTGSKWKKPLMAGADKLAEKGDYEAAIKEAKRIKMLQGIAKQEYDANPAPYNPW